MNLRDYLKKINERPSPWAVKNGLSPSVISRVLNGAAEGLTARNIQKIKEASGGEVTFEDMFPDSGELNGASSQNA